ncbi:nitroreductase [Mesonia sp. K7]|uniref:nitroreductase family protein n=1 Tax=Mesonia sp. K7 TaxID=2218606 RepID=UPI000DA7B1EC|nr:nitroreductase [Mesonia sp. K7]PZD76974.1 nitroreductase [Mesonia sp. K7]
MIEGIIKKRRSIFPVQYDKGVKVEDVIIHKMLEAANWAPTHKKTEPWRFYVVKSDKKKVLSTFMVDKYKETVVSPSDFKAKQIADKIEQSSHIIIICMQRDPKESLPEWEEVAATAMAVQNMWLVAAENKVGSYWSSPGYISKMGEFLPLKNGEKCLGLFYVGSFSGELPEGERTPIEHKVTWLD